MIKMIWKYPMGIATTHEMPEGAEFLAIQEQGDAACAWFLVLPDNPKVPRKFYVHGTGHEIPMDRKYLGTFQRPPFVWHLFEDFKEESK